jgi:hypothetical protein
LTSRFGDRSLEGLIEQIDILTGAGE